MTTPPDPPGPSPAVCSILAGIDADESGNAGAAAAVLAHRPFFIPAPSRSGSPVRARTGGIILHGPTVALLFPSDLPPLSRRRPDLADLRHVLVRFSFMLDWLPPRRAYESARLIITLATPSAVVRTQRPAWQAADRESTEFSAALEALVRVAGDQARGTKAANPRRGQLPVVTAENRGPAGFGWMYQAQEGAPLLPHMESAVAVIEMPRTAQELSGHLSAEAVITVPRFGVFTSSKSEPVDPVPFSLKLGPAEPSS